jgi:hypothetical protein
VQPTTSRTAEIRQRAARRAVEELLIVMRGQIRDRLQRNTGASHLNQDTSKTARNSVWAGTAKSCLAQDSKTFYGEILWRIRGEMEEALTFRRKVHLAPLSL